MFVLLRVFRFFRGRVLFYFLRSVFWIEVCGFERDLLVCLLYSVFGLVGVVVCFVFV